jgi:RNA polymerase sigma-70 factor (ECF subfamily)
MDEQEVNDADAALAARFRDGDPDAVREVYRRHGAALYAIARWMLRDPGHAADAVQQAFLQAWRSAATFDTSRPLGPWLAQITRRVAIDAHRRAQRRPVTVEPSGPDVATVDGDAAIDRALSVWAVRDAIDRLPPVERSVAKLAHVEGLTHQEIADRLGIPIGTVKSRGARAQGRLDGMLRHLAPSDDKGITSPAPSPHRDCGHAPPARTSRRACRDEMSSLR